MNGKNMLDKPFSQSEKYHNNNMGISDPNEEKKK